MKPENSTYNPSQPKRDIKMEQESRESSNNHVIWDCGSSLYDSFELKSFQKDLDSALVSRTLSMPHLSHRRPPPPLTRKQTSKISRSFQRLIRAVFKPKRPTITTHGSSFDEQPNRGFYVVYDNRAPKIPAISEEAGFDDLSPELRSLVGKSSSARFNSTTSLGIAC